MIHTYINVDVWCRYNGQAPIYRLYVDDQLLTERDFIWESSRHYISEHIEVSLEPGWHEIKVENCSGGDSEFFTRNIVVNGQPAGAKFVVN